MIYLASPYKHEDKTQESFRFKLVCVAAARLIAEGYKVYSPIAMTHPIHAVSMNHSCEAVARLYDRPASFWYEYDEAMMELCESLVILAIDGWRESKGVLIEYQYYLKNNLPWTVLPWFNVVDENPIFLQWFRGDLILDRAKELGV